MGFCYNACEKRFILLCVSYGCVFLSMIFIIIALTTNNWSEIWDGYSLTDKITTHFGLHRVCFTDGARCTNPEDSYDKRNYLPKVQGLVASGGFIGVFANIFCLIHLLGDRIGWTHLAIKIPAVACPLASGLLEMIGCILYAEKVELNNEYITIVKDARLGWSFGLDITAACLLIVAGFLSLYCSILRPSPKFA